jgi:8-oxo-dGTP pyrophosphatase MutT (NUDIX family)
MSWQYRNRHRLSGGGGSYARGSRSPGSFGAQGVCLFCRDVNDDRDEHSRQHCPRFKSLKSQASRSPYIDTQLKVSDAAGYAAAGILPFRRIRIAAGQGQHNTGVLEFLMVREYRDTTTDCGGDMLNFLGGKRLREKTKAIDCAIAKVKEETGGQLSRGTMAHMKDGCPLVCWSSASKYVLFLYELVGEDDRDVDSRCADVQGAKRLEWVSREESLNRSWIREQVHPFASEMLDQLTSCRIMRQLEDLFDVASEPPSTVSGSSDQDQPPQVGLTPQQVASHFDLVGAIRSSLELARPDHPSLFPASNAPTFTQIQSAVLALPTADMEKLKLRFHPERLTQVLGRTPSNDENALSIRMMQVLNGFVDTTTGTSTHADLTMEHLLQINKIRSHLDKNVDQGPGRNSDTVKELKDLLSRLSVEKCD